MLKMGYRISFTCCILLFLTLEMSKVYAQKENGHLLSIISGESVRIEQLIKQSRAILYQHTDSALGLANEALSIAHRSGNNKTIAIALRTVGAILYNGKLEHLRAKSYFEEALKYSSSLPERDASLPPLYTCLGNCYLMENNYDSASFFYYKGLNLLDKYHSKDTSAYVLLYLNIAALNSAIGKPASTLYYVGKMNEITDVQKDTEHTAGGFASLGSAYANRSLPGDMDTAISYYKKALSLIKPLNRKSSLIFLYNSIAFIYVIQNKDFKTAHAYYDSALAVDKDMAMSNTVLLKGLGGLEINLDNNKRALYYLLKGLELAKEEKKRTDILDIYDYLAIAYANLGNYEKAYENVRNFAELYDSIWNEKKMQDISHVEVKYRNLEKERELVQKKLQLSQSENNYSKLYNIYISLLAVIIIGIVLVIAIFQKQRLKLNKIKSEQQLQKLDQLKATIESEEKEKSRIGRQLHDDIMVELSIVKMGLSTLPINHPEIKQTNNYINLVEQLDNTSIKLRQTAHNLMPDVLLEEGLIPAITYFCNNIKKMTGLQIHFQHYGTIPRMPSDAEVNIYRIIQELLQNIIKHAQAGTTLVQLNYFGSTLSITVEDDGVGFDLSRVSGKHTMGITSIQTRLKALNGSIDFHARSPHGTSVNIVLPVALKTIA